MATQDWQKNAEAVKAFMAQKEPNIKVEEVKTLFGLSSESVAYYYLMKLESMGIVKRVQNGGKSEWFIAW